MTRMKQIQFVEELTNSIKGDVKQAIENGGIPKEWDGVELREYLYEKFRAARANHLLEGKRGQEYRNTITISSVL